MNLLGLFRSLLSFLGLKTMEWYPLKINKDYINYFYSNNYDNVSQGYWIPQYLKCDKIRFKCNSNITFKATTFKNYSSENCPINYEHNIQLPNYFFDNKFIVSYYLTKGSVWNINILGDNIFSVINITKNEFNKYFIREDYIRNIINNNEFVITKNYQNNLYVPKDDIYVIIISRMPEYEDTIINMKYNINSDIHCIAPNQENTVECNTDKYMSSNLTYPVDSDGLIFHLQSFNNLLHYENFECIRNN